MSQELVISSNAIETTVAIVEDGRLVEICIEQHAQKALGGSIFKGRVTRVLSGMQSAFVNLGLKRDAFLHVSDVLDPGDDIEEDPDARLIPSDSAMPDPRDEEPDSADRPEPDSEDTSDPALRSEEAAGDSARRPRRRSRRRRRPARDDDAADAGSGSGPADEPQPASGPPRKAVLPGESIAKYRGGGAADNADPVSSVEPASGSGSDSEPASPAGHETAGPSTGGGDPKAAVTEGSPPRLSASVDAPPTVAEFRLNAVDWLKRKLVKSTKPEAVPAPEPEPKRASRRRPSRSRGGRPARPGPVPSAPAKPARSRSARRARPQSRGSSPRPRTSSRHSERPERTRQTSPQANIDDLLQVDQELVVQVTKEPVGTKGVRVTSHVTFPGQYMVYMTTAKHNGVARSISPDSERTRLRKIVDKHSEEKDGGFVVRTAGSGVSEELLVADMELLYQQWSDLKAKADRRKAPARLHSDLDVAERFLRDNLGRSFDSIWVDSESEHERIVRFVKRHQPELADRVKLYTQSKPIHESFGVKKDLDKALRPKVWLKSGGYIVIEQTEALVSIDVNTGRYVGKSNRFEDTVLKTNLEAAEEIIRQVRLRDLGGIIVIDFIDMEDRKNRQNVFQILQEAFRNSRSPTRLLPFNDFGLVVMTRKTARKSLERALHMPCPCCSGSGKVKSTATVLSEIFDTAGRMAAKRNSNRGKGMTLRIHPVIGRSLKRGHSSQLDELEALLGCRVNLRSDASLEPERFTLA